MACGISADSKGLMSAFGRIAFSGTGAMLELVVGFRPPEGLGGVAMLLMPAVLLVRIAPGDS
jgi:hypothetical protein